MTNRIPIEVGQTVTVTGEVLDTYASVPGRLVVEIEVPDPLENRPRSTPRANRPDVTLDDESPLERLANRPIPPGRTVTYPVEHGRPEATT